MPKGDTTVNDKVYPSRVTKKEFLVVAGTTTSIDSSVCYSLNPKWQVPICVLTNYRGSFTVHIIHLLLVRKRAGMSKTNKNKYKMRLTMYRFVLALCVISLSPILSPSMDGLNHLREQSADTFIDKILEEMYSLLIIQIQPEFLLELETSTFIGGDIWNA